MSHQILWSLSDALRVSAITPILKQRLALSALSLAKIRAILQLFDLLSQHFMSAESAERVVTNLLDRST